MDQDKTMSLKAAYAFGAERGMQDEVNEIRNMVIEWDRSYTSSLRRGYILELFQKRGIFEDFKHRYWPEGDTPAGRAKEKRYLRIKREYEDFLAGRSDGGEEDEVESDESDQQFAAESDLRDFLAQNLTTIEPGLSLYNSGEKKGVEFCVEGGRIDILAIDRGQKFVVIELKLARGRNKTIGQLLYYMGWVDKNLGKGPCRGMIIARDIPDDLTLAVQRAPGVSLYRYHLAVSVEPISQKP